MCVGAHSIFNSQSCMFTLVQYLTPRTIKGILSRLICILCLTISYQCLLLKSVSVLLHYVTNLSLMTTDPLTLYM